MFHRVQFGKTEYFLCVGDIVDQTTDAIVNAANSALAGGGGVDGAIHKRGGPQILQECRVIVQQQGKCHAGNAVITGPGELNTKHVIHAVGPHWRGGGEGEEEILRSTYLSCLSVARENNIKTIAFPSISTGAYRFPKALAATVAQKSVLEIILKDDFFEKVGFVLFDKPTYEIYFSEFSKLFEN